MGLELHGREASAMKISSGIRSARCAYRRPRAVRSGRGHDAVRSYSSVTAE